MLTRGILMPSLFHRIARGGWGLVEADCHVAVKEGGEAGPYVLARDFAWDTIAPLGCFAPKSEYTKYR